jgi:hypothetical protein
MKMTIGEVRRVVRSVIVEARASDPVGAMKKLLQLPGDVKVSTRNGATRLAWSKKGGLGGGKVISRVENAAKAAGWQKGGYRDSSVSDGSRVGNDNVWRDTAGNEMTLSSSYGSTQASNWYSIDVKLAAQGTSSV